MPENFFPFRVQEDPVLKAAFRVIVQDAGQKAPPVKEHGPVLVAQTDELNLNQVARNPHSDPGIELIFPVDQDVETIVDKGAVSGPVEVQVVDVADDLVFRNPLHLVKNIVAFRVEVVRSSGEKSPS